ncbi:MAG: hypothetical protein SFU25_04000 [Candidatus Caenarcaniphilales bacterium]|nr:hypothetical protein [Candidatus Caenarcaniphilales bacterium]
MLIICPKSQRLDKPIYFLSQKAASNTNPINNTELLKISGTQNNNSTNQTPSIENQPPEDNAQDNNWLSKVALACGALILLSSALFVGRHKQFNREVNKNNPNSSNLRDSLGKEKKAASNNLDEGTAGTDDKSSLEIISSANSNPSDSGKREFVNTIAVGLPPFTPPTPEKIPESGTLSVASAGATIVPAITTNYKHNYIPPNNLKAIGIEQKLFTPSGGAPLWNLLMKNIFGSEFQGFHIKTRITSDLKPRIQSLIQGFQELREHELVLYRKRNFKKVPKSELYNTSIIGGFSKQILENLIKELNFYGHVSYELEDFGDSSLPSSDNEFTEPIPTSNILFRDGQLEIKQEYLRGNSFLVFPVCREQKQNSGVFGKATKYWLSYFNVHTLNLLRYLKLRKEISKASDEDLRPTLQEYKRVARRIKHELPPHDLLVLEAQMAKLTEDALRTIEKDVLVVDANYELKQLEGLLDYLNHKVKESEREVKTVHHLEYPLLAARASYRLTAIYEHLLAKHAYLLGLEELPPVYTREELIGRGNSFLQKIQTLKQESISHLNTARIRLNDNSSLFRSWFGVDDDAEFMESPDNDAHSKWLDHKITSYNDLLIKLLDNPDTSYVTRYNTFEVLHNYWTTLTKNP